MVRICIFSMNMSTEVCFCVLLFISVNHSWYILRTCFFLLFGHVLSVGPSRRGYELNLGNTSLGQLTHKLQTSTSGALFWYEHHPTMHELVSDRSSGAENWTDLRKNSMRNFFDSTQIKNTSVGLKCKCVIVREKNL